MGHFMLLQSQHAALIYEALLIFNVCIHQCICTPCPDGVCLTAECRPRSLCLFSAPTKKYDHSNQRILNVEYRAWGRI